jgi:hypothetical protein
MLEILKDFKNGDFDMLMFTPNLEKDDVVDIETVQYIERGERIDSSEMGDSYHIVLFKEDNDGNVANLDYFEAILTDCLEYASGLIPHSWYGFICRKTTTSHTVLNKILDNLKNM